MVDETLEREAGFSRVRFAFSRACLVRNDVVCCRTWGAYDCVYD